jgi:DNA-binding transcriptional MocR family regulator
VTRYAEIAELLRARLRAGELAVGTRLPGVRRLAHQHGVSVSTVVAALQRLEDEGWLEARPRSGFYVRARRSAGAVLPRSAPPPAPAAVTSQGITMEIVRASGRPGVLQLGTAVPEASFLPLNAVQRALGAAARRHRRDALAYAFPPGVAALRAVVAERLAEGGCRPDPDEVLVTSGTQEATQLALRVLTKPGDVVAVESPTYYGLLQVIESLGLEALEIPTDPRRGIDLQAFARALDRWPIRALALVPHCSNPTGYVMAEEDRRALVELCAAREVPVIEDDVYADLAVEADGSGLRPRALRAVDAEQVFLCGSASKTVAPGLRIGWLVAPARYRERLEYLKYAGSLSASPLAQHALAELLGNRGIARHLRRVRDRYAELTGRGRELLLAALPEGTVVSDPAGGFVLWAQLPPDVDAIALYRTAAEAGIVVAPGPIFSASGRYENCLRINVAIDREAELERAIVRLGVLAERTRAGALRGAGIAPARR